MNTILASAAAASQVVYFDHGVYLVKKTIDIPPGSKIVGETYAVIMSSGTAFANINFPQPVVRVGKSGQTGIVEWSDMIVSTQGAQPGAILIQWNLASPIATPAGMWDVHTRVGGFAGSRLQVANCPITPNTVVTSVNLNKNCIAAFMNMHITKFASGVYMENNWLWVADHDIDSASLTQVTIYAGRGLLIESTAGGIWLIGTSVEHHTLYQYQISGSTNVFMGQIQTETAYYQPNPGATIPFPAFTAYNDPVLPTGSSGYGLRVVNSANILVYGAGLYSFFSNYNTACSNQGNGETCQMRILSVESSTMSAYNLNTVGVTKMITRNGVDIAAFSDNLDGFVDTVALFRG